jgi:hypothetical protein
MSAFAICTLGYATGQVYAKVCLDTVCTKEVPAYTGNGIPAILPVTDGFTD